MKTPEEIKKALECCGMMDDDGCCKCPYNDGACDFQLERDAFEYIQRLEDHIHCLINMMPEWVSVKERLPENAQRCIVITGFQHSDVCVATYYEISSRGNPNGDWIFDDGDGWLDTVAADYWMPLPKLPEKKHE